MAIGNSTTFSDTDLQALYEYSFKNLTMSSSIPEDSIIDKSLKLEKRYSGKEHQEILFLIKQIAINAYCLKGEIGLAINKANQMYEEAQRTQNPLGLALSLQAIGDTYMHANQPQQAYASFCEAEKLIATLYAPAIKAKLGIQQMHVCMSLGKTQELEHHLVAVAAYAEQIDEQLKDDVHFYIACYQALCEIAKGDQQAAKLNLDKAFNIEFSHEQYHLWHYYVYSRYYELSGEYDKASLYCDSVLQCLGNRNMNAYITFSIQQASLYEKQQLLDKATDIYAKMNRLADSLNITQYTNQIDSLHTIYKIDRMKIENAEAYNQMLTHMMIYCIIGVITLIVVIYLVKKRNRLLIESQKELCKKRNEAADSIQSKSLFLSNMSHELRTPLNAIVGFSGLLADNGATDPELKQQCGEVIKRNSELLLKLINDIVDLSDLNEKNFKFVWKEHDVVALCRSVVDTVENVKRVPSTLSFMTNIDSLVLETDDGRLQQVLINLLINATKFTPEGSITLKLELLPQQDYATFTVEDTGCGIPLEKQPSIFQRFEKLHEGVQGAGLGLSICQLIIEHVGGEIWIDSTYTQGARFVFTHPLHKTITEEAINK